MTNEQQMEQIGTYVQTVVDIETTPLPTLAARMRYQRALLREVLMFWPSADGLQVVEQVIGPVVARLRS